MGIGIKTLFQTYLLCTCIFFPSPPPNTNASGCQDVENLDSRHFRNRKANTFGLKQFMGKKLRRNGYILHGICIRVEEQVV